jgi:ABC-type lipoprotein release transport system permease subunit
MYKLFLTFRYLTRKKIVIFPILVVWLCVMMLIIVTSIMQGFVDRVRDANRDLFGDIIVSSPSSSQGFAGYDELSQQIKAQFPEVLATTPVVETYAILYVGSVQRSVPSLLVGVKPEERSAVSQFRQSLFQQYQAPMQAVDILSPRLPATGDALASSAQKHYETTQHADDEARKALASLIGTGGVAHTPGPAYGRLWTLALVAIVTSLLSIRARRLQSAGAYVFTGIVGLAGAGFVVLAVFWPVMFPRQFDLAEDRIHQTMMATDQAMRTLDLARSLPPAATINTRADLIKALVPPAASFGLPAAAQNLLPGTPPLPAEGCIVGSQIGFYRRDTRGNFVHNYPDNYPKVSLTVFPPSKSGRISVQASNAVTQDFTIVDDSHSGVYDVDSLNVYAPFETVQMMAGMRADPRLVAQDPTAGFPPRTHQILLRLTPAGETRLKELRAKIDEFVQARVKDGALDVQTWDEKQARYLGAVQNEKTMMTFIMLLMSGVVLVVIFLIFYQIVRDKTRDIGIIKAVGGSEIGVAGIFLSYGLMIGIVGGGLGALAGVLFMTHTNQIHEWIFQMTGMIIWDRSVYLFDRIPDVVRLSDVVTYFCVALVAGVVGALIPAVLAALEDPVQAVRYE